MLLAYGKTRTFTAKSAWEETKSLFNVSFFFARDAHFRHAASPQVCAVIAACRINQWSSGRIHRCLGGDQGTPGSRGESVTVTMTIKVTITFTITAAATTTFTVLLLLLLLLPPTPTTAIHLMALSGRPPGGPRRPRAPGPSSRAPPPTRPWSPGGSHFVSFCLFLVFHCLLFLLFLYYFVFILSPGGKHAASCMRRICIHDILFRLKRTIAHAQICLYDILLQSWHTLRNFNNKSG